VTESLSSVPGLSHLPILGALFKSRDITKSKTELLVMVTPEAAYPLAATDPKPLPHMPKAFLPQPAAVSGRKPIASGNDKTVLEAPVRSAK
jgi:Flp pilus assembly secretin CpaC